MSTIIYAILIIITVEFLIYFFVLFFKKECKWLITAIDEEPIISKKLLDKFFNKSFDPVLGWVRRPNDQGIDKGQDGDVFYSIDNIGSRTSNSKKSPKIVAFGDSYVFCKQVNDDQTWENILEDLINEGVSNFGVGNYGADQAVIRYEETDFPSSVKIAVLGFVPETICRVQSVWKHYLEFGNILAFKPRFDITEKDDIFLYNLPLTNLNDFIEYKKFLPIIKERDRFYKTKFKKMQFKFPYSIVFAKSFFRNVMLFKAIVLDYLHKKFKYMRIKNKDFTTSTIIKENIKDSHSLYSDEYSRRLLRAIINKFKNVAISKGHHPLILVFPQLDDLKLLNSSDNYQRYFNSMSHDFDIIDFTPIFLGQVNQEELYISDSYGGHLSEKGNRVVANYLYQYFNNCNIL